MKRLILAILLCLACTQVRATEVTLPANERHVNDNLTGPHYRDIVGQKLEPIEDGHLNYVTVMGVQGEPKYEACKMAFTANMRVNVHYSEMNTESGMFKNRYAATVPALPCVRVQSPDGTVLFQKSGPSLDVASIQAGCRPFCKPQPKPTPAVEPKLEPETSTPQADVQADVEADGPNPLLLGLLAVGGGGAGLVGSARKKHYGHI